jgi:hypothetical protein
MGSRWQSRARALMCLSKGTVCRRRLLLFLLAGLLLCLLRFLSHVALRDPKVGSMQVDLDMHKYRVHHNCKIDTARFEEGKRRSHRSALRVRKPLSRCVDAIRGHGLLPSWKTSALRLTRSHAANGKQLGAEAILLGAIACASTRAHCMFVAILSGRSRSGA